MSFNFDAQSVCSILDDASLKSYVIINTPRSPFNGQKYQVLQDRLYNSIWNVRVKRNKRNCYYDWDAVKLSDCTQKKFDKFTNRNHNIHDVLGKHIQKNGLLHNDGAFLKVEFTTGQYIYVTDLSNEYRFNKYLYEMTNRQDGESYFRIDRTDSDRFLLVDNPLDILRI